MLVPACRVKTSLTFRFKIWWWWWSSSSSIAFDRASVRTLRDQLWHYNIDLTIMNFENPTDLTLGFLPGCYFKSVNTFTGWRPRYMRPSEYQKYSTFDLFSKWGSWLLKFIFFWGGGGWRFFWHTRLTWQPTVPPTLTYLKSGDLSQSSVKHILPTRMHPVKCMKEEEEEEEERLSKILKSVKCCDPFIGPRMRSRPVDIYQPAYGSTDIRFRPEPGVRT